MPQAQLWRYGQAGDLPGEGDEIDKVAMGKLVRANRGRAVIAFTHKPPTPENLEILRDARDNGFLVNLSADSLDEADELADTGFPVVVVLPAHYGQSRTESLCDWRKRFNTLPKVTKAGRRVAPCPATYSNTTCFQCGLCSRLRPNGTVIGFPAHGARKKLIN